MLDLLTTSPFLHTLHQRFVDEALPAHVRGSVAEFDASPYTAAQLLGGRCEWEQRALDEYRSQIGLTEFLQHVSEARLAFDALGVAIRVVRDEARHVELCRRMVIALGGTGKIEGEPQWRRADASRPLLARILDTVVGSLCLGETMSAALLVASRTAATDPVAKQVLTVMAADETIHGRFGWTLLEELWPELPDSVRGSVVERLEPWLGQLGRDALNGESRASPFGALDTATRRGVFLEQLESNVLAPFDGLGIPARAAWEAARARL